LLRRLLNHRAAGELDLRWWRRLLSHRWLRRALCARLETW